MIEEVIEKICNQLSIDNFYTVGSEDEFNEVLDDVTEGPVILLVDSYTTQEKINISGTFDFPIFPIEIFILDSVYSVDNGEAVFNDPTGRDLARVRHNMRALGRELVQRFIKEDLYKKTNAQELEFTFSNQEEKFDSLLAGVLLSFEAPLFLEYDYCIPKC